MKKRIVLRVLCMVIISTHFNCKEEKTFRGKNEMIDSAEKSPSISSEKKHTGQEIYIDSDDYNDGEYCALVEYYNPNTYKKSIYTLKVKVEGERLVFIQWPNGGRLDESHFIPPDISEGVARFSSDQGHEYVVKLSEDYVCDNFIPQEGSIYDLEIDNTIKRELEEAKICPKCKGDKYPADNYCDDCSRKLFKTY
jgi:hypothetical protein